MISKERIPARTTRGVCTMHAYVGSHEHLWISSDHSVFSARYVLANARSSYSHIVLITVSYPSRKIHTMTIKEHTLTL